MNKLIKLTGMVIFIFVSFSHGAFGIGLDDLEPHEQGPCHFCKHHKGLPRAGKKINDFLMLDPIYQIVTAKKTQKEKDAYLNELKNELHGEEQFKKHNWHHFLSAILAGANPNSAAGGFFGRPLLAMAYLSGPIVEECMQWLLDHGADPKIKIDTDTPNALWLAKTVSMATLLLNAGASPAGTFPIWWRRDGEVSIFDNLDMLMLEDHQQKEKESIKALYRCSRTITNNN